MAENLNTIVKNHNVPNKEHTYKEVYRFIKNFARFEMDPELIVKKKIGQYLSIIYTLLTEINDSVSETYSKLLVESSNLLGRIKKQLVAYVYDPLTSVQIRHKETRLQLLHQRKRLHPNERGAVPGRENQLLDPELS